MFLTKILISKLESRVAILEELIETLISNAVTGKIDVCDIEMPEYERIEEDLGEDAAAESETKKTEEQED